MIRTRQQLDSLSSALGLGPSAEGPLARTKSFYAKIDAEIAKKNIALDLPCRLGCDACCHESVFLSAPEFLTVAEHLFRTRTEQEVRSLVAEMETLAEKFSDELEILESIEPGFERDEVAARIKFRCPLLTSAGVCSVYEARELNARTFGQTYDHKEKHAYGCELTQSHLHVIQPEPALLDARLVRRRFAEAVSSLDTVHVYPWWFRKFSAYF